MQQLSVTKKEKFKLSNKLQEKIFHIRLQTSNQEIDISNTPNFVKLIEQEYASKYLETLKIDTTQKNINLILKYHPLKQCKINASWNSSGLYADTITIIARNNKKNQAENENEKENNSDLLLKKLADSIQGKKKGLKSGLLQEGAEKKEQDQESSNKKVKNTNNSKDVKQKPTKKENEHKDKIRNSLVIEEEEEELERKFKLDFSVETIKNKYIFPFNQTLRRKKNIGLRDNYESALPNISDNEKDISILNRKLFGYPYTLVKLGQGVLKELQKPITITPEEIEKELILFNASFPKNIIPYEKKEIKDQKQKSLEKNKKNEKNSPMKSSQENDHLFRDVFLKEVDIEKTFDLLRSKEMAKFIGIFSHLAYWLVFGHVNPIELDVLSKKQIFVQLYEILMEFNSKAKQKVWVYLIMPMILLTLKMELEYIFRISFPLFFEEEDGKPDIALDKIYFLVDRIFDQNNLNGRLIFLESDTEAIMKKISGIVNERQYLRKRLYGLSPFIDYLIPHPKDGKTRAILSKKINLEIKDPLLKSIAKNRNMNKKSKSINSIRYDNNIKNQDDLNNSYELQMLHVYLNNLQRKEYRVQNDKKEALIKNI